MSKKISNSTVKKQSFHFGDPVQVRESSDSSFQGRYGEVTKILYPEQADENGKKIPTIVVGFSDDSEANFKPWDLDKVIIQEEQELSIV